MQRKRSYEIAFGLALVGIGGGLAVMGLVQFDRISSLEALGRVQEIDEAVKPIYAQAGKWGVLASFGIAGILGLFIGGNTLLDGSPEREPVETARTAPDLARRGGARIATREQAVPLAVGYVRRLRERGLTTQHQV